MGSYKLPLDTKPLNSMSDDNQTMDFSTPPTMTGPKMVIKAGLPSLSSTIEMSQEFSGSSGLLSTSIALDQTIRSLEDFGIGDTDPTSVAIDAVRSLGQIDEANILPEGKRHGRATYIEMEEMVNAKLETNAGNSQPQKSKPVDEARLAEKAQRREAHELKRERETQERVAKELNIAVHNGDTENLSISAKKRISKLKKDPMVMMLALTDAMTLTYTPSSQPSPVDSAPSQTQNHSKTTRSATHNTMLNSGPKTISSATAQAIALAELPMKKSVSAKLKQRKAKAKETARKANRIERAAKIAGVELPAMTKKGAERILRKEALKEELTLAMSGKGLDHLDKGTRKRILYIRQRYLYDESEQALPSFDYLVAKIGKDRRHEVQTQAQKVRLKREDIAASGVDLDTLSLPKNEKGKIRLIRKKMAGVAEAGEVAEGHPTCELDVDMEM